MKRKCQKAESYFLSLLRDLKKKHREIGDVDGLGLALRVEICKSDSFTPDRELTEKMFLEGLKGTLSYKDRNMD